MYVLFFFPAKRQLVRRGQNNRFHASASKSDENTLKRGKTGNKIDKEVERVGNGRSASQRAFCTIRQVAVNHVKLLTSQSLYYELS